MTSQEATVFYTETVKFHCIVSYCIEFSTYTILNSCLHKQCYNLMSGEHKHCFVSCISTQYNTKECLRSPLMNWDNTYTQYKAANACVLAS